MDSEVVLSAGQLSRERFSGYCWATSARAVQLRVDLNRLHAIIIPSQMEV
jgi:hypothetical protein